MINEDDEEESVRDINDSMHHMSIHLSSKQITSRRTERVTPSEKKHRQEKLLFKGMMHNHQNKQLNESKEEEKETNFVYMIDESFDSCD